MLLMMRWHCRVLRNLLFTALLWSSVVEAATAAAAAAHDTSGCGQPTDHFSDHHGTIVGKRVVGGSPTTTRSFPWTVLIKRYGHNGVVCTGAILSHRLVLTAAHCFDNVALAEIYIWVGKDELDYFSLHSLVQLVESVYLHPSYNRNTKKSDLALLRTASDIIYNSNVRPVCLPPFADDYNANSSTPPPQTPLPILPPTTPCFLAGYGDTLGTGSDRRLNFIQVPLLTSSLCSQEDWLGQAFREVKDVSFCAGYADGGPDACVGDSGAALVCPHATGYRYYVYGVASWGKGCGERKRPGVYTRVSDFLPWINTYLNPTH